MAGIQRAAGILTEIVPAGARVWISYVEPLELADGSRRADDAVLIPDRDLPDRVISPGQMLWLAFVPDAASPRFDVRVLRGSRAGEEDLARARRRWQAIRAESGGENG